MHGFKNLKCTVCDQNKLELIKPIPDSFRKNVIFCCLKCGTLQSRYPSSYKPKEDPHSLQFIGQRHISSSDGTRWGNIRHGKGLRFDIHQSLLDKTIKEFQINSVYEDGANRGHFTKYAYDNNLIYHGVEPDIMCFKDYKKHFNVLNCYTENFKKNIKVDFIYSSHTLEHVDSVYQHLKILCGFLKNKGIFFLDLPNTQQIEYEDLILEEYFVEKHVTNFYFFNIINLFKFFGFNLLFSAVDPYNITAAFVFEKKNYMNCHINIFKNLNHINIQKKIIFEYYQKMEISKKKLKNIVKYINNHFHKKIIFYGGGRIFNTFLKLGLKIDKVKFVIDNYLFDKIKLSDGINLYSHDFLLRNSIPKSTPIIILARSSIIQIKTTLSKDRFSNVYEINELR